MGISHRVRRYWARRQRRSHIHRERAYACVCVCVCMCIGHTQFFSSQPYLTLSGAGATGAGAGADALLEDPPILRKFLWQHQHSMFLLSRRDKFRENSVLSENLTKIKSAAWHCAFAGACVRCAARMRRGQPAYVRGRPRWRRRAGDGRCEEYPRGRPLARCHGSVSAMIWAVGD